MHAHPALPVVGLPHIERESKGWGRFGILTLRRVTGREFYAHTFPGCNGRPDFQGEATAEKRAEDLRKRLDVFQIERAHLVAIGSGAAPAFAFAERFPDRVASITLLGVPEGFGAPESTAPVHLVHGDCPHITTPEAAFGPTAQFWKAHDGAR